MSAVCYFLYLTLPTVNQFFYWEDVEKLCVAYWPSTGTDMTTFLARRWQGAWAKVCEVRVLTGGTFQDGNC